MDLSICRQALPIEIWLENPAHELETTRRPLVRRRPRYLGICLARHQILQRLRGRCRHRPLMLRAPRLAGQWPRSTRAVCHQGDRMGSLWHQLWQRPMPRAGWHSQKAGNSVSLLPCHMIVHSSRLASPARSTFHPNSIQHPGKSRPRVTRDRTLCPALARGSLAGLDPSLAAAEGKPVARDSAMASVTPPLA